MPKTDAGKRTIIIPKFTVESLEAIQPPVTRPDMPVFPSRQFRDGRASMKPQTPHNVRRTLRAALELAQMTGEVHPHLLRSTVATFVARERGMADAAALLGHKVNGGVTARHYIERLRLAPDTSAVLQAMVEIGEEEATKATHRRTTRAAAAQADAPAVTAERVLVADEDSGP